MFRRSITLLLLLLSLLAGGAPFAPAGRAAAPPFTGLDVVILIDQSGSMWGALPLGVKNDKWNHRIGQAKNIIYRLAEQVEGTDLVHRVAVVDFGDEASAAFPAPLRLAYDPADPGSALRGAKAVAERYLTPKALINTNTPAGMAAGLREYDRMDSSGRLEGRRRVMLILTDGRPDLPRVKTTDELKGEAIKEAEALKARGVGIWVVGLNDASNYWNGGDGEFWERLTGVGRARLAETAAMSISALVQEIVNEWLGSAGEAIGNSYECPPYLRRVVFSVTFGVPRSGVRVIDPDGKELSLSSGGAASAPGTFARFTAEDPVPGVYRVEQDPSRSYANFVEIFPPNIQRLSPGRRTSAEAEARIIFRVTNSRGQPLEPLAGWPLLSSVVVTSPAGEVTELPTSFEGDGKFQANWKPPGLGSYRVRLKGVVTLKGGKTVDVFASDSGAYEEWLEVDNSRPYRLQMTSPNPAGGLRVMPWDTEARVEFSLLDPRKAKVEKPEEVVRDAGSWLSLQVIDESGVAVSPPEPLTLTPAGTFAANVPVRLNWKGGEGWWFPGHLSLRVNAQTERLGAESFLDGIDLPEGAEALRIGSDPLTVGPVGVRYSWLLLVPALLLLLAVPLALAAWLFPNSLVWWIDARKRRTVELKIYDGNEDPNGDYAKRLPAGSWKNFKYDRKVSIPVNGQEVLARKFRVSRVADPDVVHAQLEYGWQNEPKQTYTVLLTKGKAQRLKGLPSGDVLVSLDTVP